MQSTNKVMANYPLKFGPTFRKCVAGTSPTIMEKRKRRRAGQHDSVTKHGLYTSRVMFRSTASQFSVRSASISLIHSLHGKNKLHGQLASLCLCVGVVIAVSVDC